MGHISTKEIVDLLITDEYYVTNWKQFYYDLRAPHPDFVQLEMLYNSGARPFHDIIMKILNNWVAIQRNPPSVRKLYGVLLSGDFVSVAGKNEGFFLIIQKICYNPIILIDMCGPWNLSLIIIYNFFS